jgi:hypothetical protein
VEVEVVAKVGVDPDSGVFDAGLFEVLLRF